MEILEALVELTKMKNSFTEAAAYQRKPSFFLGRSDEKEAIADEYDLFADQLDEAIQALWVDNNAAAATVLKALGDEFEAAATRNDARKSEKWFGGSPDQISAQYREFVAKTETVLKLVAG